MKPSQENGIFVVGCPRSGTTLLNSIIMSDPRCVVYEAESLLLDVCRPRYGRLTRDRAYRKFLCEWFASKQFQRSALTRDEFLAACEPQRSDYPQLLGAFFGALRRKQGAELWVDSTPDHIFYLRELASAFPLARVLHIVRDPRAVVPSLCRLGWSGAKPGADRRTQIQSAACRWRLSVEAGRRGLVAFAGRAVEIGYEDLIRDTGSVLDRLNRLLGTQITHKSLARRRYGSLERSNSAFAVPGDDGGLDASALERWRSSLSEEECAEIEVICSSLMTRYGYPREYPRTSASWSAGLLQTRLRIREALRRHTVLGRLSRRRLEPAE